MGPGTRSSPSPPSPLLLSLLPLLLLLSPTVRGDCGPPPEIPNATPEVDGKTSFPEQSFVVYSCNKDYRKIPGKQDTVSCQNDQWSSLDTFCNKSCSAPTRVTFASLKTEYINVNYFPIGSTVQYECRPGYQRVPSLSVKSTCLDNLEWSTVAEFCKRKSCPNPGDLQNGNINIPTDILFGSGIYFSCNTGYKLVGVDSVFCYVTEKTVEWSDQFPECIEILCPDPPQIKNGEMQGESKTYVYRQSVTYSCATGFVLVGNSSIYCTVNGDQGEWSGPAPQCTEKPKITTTTRKSITVTVPTTRVPSTSLKPTTGTRGPPLPQKPTTVNVPGTRGPPTSQKPTTVNITATQRVPDNETTTHHPTGTSEKKERSTSGDDRLIYGFVAGILAIDSIIIVKTSWTLYKSNGSSNW
uniref:complement decay-accelerating factor, GPI-anchored-like isoform X2 n=1 Tax=Myodes glareolus TaxID=447135 RepID=UPI00201FE53B|nr:complement decay-accelerating factor, GPI-anchored-like isoform X2 [Myodes glareolus]